MITEQYVEFETAKLLKEKVFDINCNALYDITTGQVSQRGVGYVFNNGQWNNFILAPSQSLVMRWLREVHNIYLQFNPYWAEGDMRNPCNWYWTWISLENIHEADRPSYGGKTYEECAENAIKYCLENLI